LMVISFWIPAMPPSCVKDIVEGSFKRNMIFERPIVTEASEIIPEIKNTVSFLFFTELFQFCHQIYV
jgi:hypothetical protein